MEKVHCEPLRPLSWGKVRMEDWKDLIIGSWQLAWYTTTSVQQLIHRGHKWTPLLLNHTICFCSPTCERGRCTAETAFAELALQCCAFLFVEWLFSFSYIKAPSVPHSRPANCQHFCFYKHDHTYPCNSYGVYLVLNTALQWLKLCLTNIDL